MFHHYQLSFVINTAKNQCLSLSLFLLMLSFAAFPMSSPNIHGTSTASAGFASGSEGSTAGTLEASWRVRTDGSYVGSQYKIGDLKKSKNLI